MPTREDTDNISLTGTQSMRGITPTYLYGAPTLPDLIGNRQHAMDSNTTQGSLTTSKTVPFLCTPAEPIRERLSRNLAVPLRFEPTRRARDCSSQQDYVSAVPDVGCLTQISRMARLRTKSTFRTLTKSISIPVRSFRSARSWERCSSPNQVNRS